MMRPSILLKKRSARRRRAAQRGFSMIEVLVTLGVTSIALTGLLALYTSMLRGNRDAAAAAEAGAVAKQTLEDIRATPFADLVDPGNYGPTPVDSDIGPSIGRNGMEFRRRVLITDIDTDLVLIRVEVGWTDDGAAEGADGGRYDHLISLEMIRWRNDVT